MSTAEEFKPHYSVDDYQLWDGDWELWNGVAVAMTPSPFGRHSRLLVNVSFALKTAINEAKCDATVLAEIDWIVDQHTVLRPDVVVVCGREPERHLEHAPAIAVEILSESTRERDLTHKRSLYAEQRVPIYLIVDPVAATLTSLEIADDEYAVQAFDDQLKINICNTCQLEINVPTIFA